ncbi:MAG: S41 family peptidase [Lachnospiraceae bacterium]|nr:S41 family peptidase [Lachnospiraceae bacterium]
METTSKKQRHIAFLRIIPIMLVMVLAIGMVPVNAKSKNTREIPSVEVSSKDELVKQLKTDGEETIIFTTDETASVTIPKATYSSKKHLVIRAANTTVTNKTKFASVTIEAIRKYTEMVSGNDITVSSDGAQINIYNKKKVANLTINASNVDISVKKKATIKNIAIKNSEGLKIRFDDETNDAISISKAEYEKYQQFSEALTLYDMAKAYYYKDVDPVTLAEGAARGVLAELNDPYSYYYNPQEWANMFLEDEGKYVGIGVLINTNLETKTCSVCRVFENTPAQEVGIQRGDIIYKIGEDFYVTSDNITEAVKIMRGIPGTDVNITFLRNGKEISYTITRRDINVNEVSSTMLDGDIGYIALYQFSGNCDGEFAFALNKLVSQGAKGIIIDLRDNTGGWVDQAQYIADLFMDEGELCYLTYRNGQEDHESFVTKDGKTDVKLVILINENSASSSEILSGALRDCANASLVGTTSFGKGIVQIVLPVGNRGAGCQITVAQYFTPNGYAVHGQGITPDYIVKLPKGDNGMYDFADTKNDVQLKKAVEVMKQKLN